MRGEKIKHIPIRTCVGCRNTGPKNNLIRVVTTADGLVIDLSGKANGRGAYLHPARACWEKGLKGSLSHALKVEFTEKDTKLLVDFMDNIPDIE